MAALPPRVGRRLRMHSLAVGDVLEQHDGEGVAGEVLKAQHLLGRRHPAAASRFLLPEALITDRRVRLQRNCARWCRQWGFQGVNVSAAHVWLSLGSEKQARDTVECNRTTTGRMHTTAHWPTCRRCGAAPASTATTCMRGVLNGAEHPWERGQASKGGGSIHLQSWARRGWGVQTRVAGRLGKGGQRLRCGQHEKGRGRVSTSERCAGGTDSRTVRVGARAARALHQAVGCVHGGAEEK